MDILLIRHFESQKNVSQKLSSGENNEPLTEAGRKAGFYVGEVLQQLFGSMCVIPELHAASSQRGRESADIICSVLGLSGYEVHDDLNSTRVGAFAGSTLSDLTETDAKLGAYLMLYEAGLLNLYCRDRDIPLRGKEPKLDYEKRVMMCFERVVAGCRGQVLLCLGHKAALTAILINVARRLGVYPGDHFGYVPLNLGSISVMTYSNENYKIFKVNSSVDEVRLFSGQGGE